MPDSVIIYRESLQPFSVACGTRRALTLAVAHREKRISADIQSFDKPFVRIGRNMQNDLMLPDEAVSFRHLYLQMVDGHWAYFNLHSTVHSKGRRRQQPTWGWLDEAGEVNVGPFCVSAEPTGTPDPTQISPPRDRALTPVVTKFELELVNRQNFPARQIQRPVTLIGSARHCDLWLKDPSVSSVHASLVLTPSGVWVVDLLGRNGITVDQRRVSWKQLQNGSFLEIGRFCFRVWINNAEPLTVDPLERSAPPPLPADLSLMAGPIDGSLTRDFVMGVLNHLVESRTEFFDHLRHQSQLIHQLFGQLNELRPAPLGRELQRIEELDRELFDIKQRLSQLTSALEASAFRPDSKQAVLENTADSATCEPSAAGVPEASPLAALDRAEEERNGRADPGADREELEPRVPHEEPQLDCQLPSPPPPKPDSQDRPAISVQEAHALLSQRMSRLAHERTGLLNTLLRRLGLTKRL